VPPYRQHTQDSTNIWLDQTQLAKSMQVLASCVVMQACHHGEPHNNRTRLSTYYVQLLEDQHTGRKKPLCTSHRGAGARGWQLTRDPGALLPGVWDMLLLGLARCGIMPCCCCTASTSGPTLSPSSDTSPGAVRPRVTARAMLPALGTLLPVLCRRMAYRTPTQALQRHCSLSRQAPAVGAQFSRAMHSKYVSKQRHAVSTVLHVLTHLAECVHPRGQAKATRRTCRHMIRTHRRTSL
jgi:hypothetical protein